MRGRLFVSSVIFISSTFLINLCSSINLEQKNHHREGKVFSLFNIVKFDNGGCESTESIDSGGNRNGTCYTSSECGDKGGTSKGSCAAGFGVCCLFILSSSDSTDVSQNCTYIQNEGFPAALTTAKSKTYSVKKCSDDVCFLRLDFEKFLIKGPSNTVETDDGTWSATNPGGGTCDKDTFIISTDVKTSTYPTICGENGGQHVYIELGSSASSSASLAFTMTDDDSRKYDIKITQLMCGSTNAPPTGCLQYFTTVSGQFKTFNFDATGSTHLKEQDYQVCFRKEKGFCCNQYTVCAEDNFGDLNFTLYPDTGAYTAGTTKFEESLCTNDYITITGSVTCGTTGVSRSRYCGSRLAITKTTNDNTAICDCTPGFEVGIHTDALADKYDQGDAANTRSRGACLDFKQVPC